MKLVDCNFSVFFRHFLCITITFLIQNKIFSLEPGPIITLLNAKERFETPQNIKFNLHNPEKSAQFLRENILKTYGFQADTTERGPRIEPLQWISGVHNPARRLLVGSPAHFKRPELGIEFPVYGLAHLSYFEGEGKLFSAINTCVRLWKTGAIKETWAAFDVLDEEIHKLSPHTLNWVTARLLRGFFYLNMASLSQGEHKKWFEEPYTSTLGLFPEELDAQKLANMASLEFFETLGTSDVSLFASTIQDKINTELFNGMLENPQFFRKSTRYGPKVKIGILKEHLEPILWVRSVAFFAYWDAAVLQQGEGTWQNSFTMSEKMVEFNKRIQKSLPHKSNVPPVILMPDTKAMRNPLGLVLHTGEDFEAVLEIMKAQAHSSNNEVVDMIYYADAAIRKAHNSELKSLAFLLAANGYFDINNPRLARKVYGWSAAVSRSFTEKFPLSLLMGGESAFWNGENILARDTYNLFLENMGDAEFGPWIHLRLAELDYREGLDSDALKRDLEIIRNFQKHLVFKESTVRMYCKEAPTLTRKAREKEYIKLKSVIFNARSSLQEQAKACLLQTDLSDLSETTAENKNQVAAEASSQLRTVDEFKKDFPDSYYLKLFEDSERKLKLSEGVQLAVDKQCRSLLKFYKENETQLDSLSTKAVSLVKGLSWGPSERQTLVRCAGLLRHFDVWKGFLDTGVKLENDELQRQLYLFLAKRNDKNADKLWKILRKNGLDFWDTHLLAFGKWNGSLVEEEHFWTRLAVTHLNLFDQGLPAAERKKFRKSFLSWVRDKPERAVRETFPCRIWLEEAQALKISDWDKLASLKAADDWIDWDDFDDESPSEEITCQNQLSRRLFLESFQNPSHSRDASLLPPWLEATGVLDASEEWIAWARRLAKTGKTVKARSAYEKIEKETDDPVVKEAARIWLKKNGAKSRSFW